ncbi:MAG TPA: ACP S-malonyltransferase [Paralcaligenes sp.]
MKIAFVFPGQGSQSVGMLNAWAGNPVVADTLAQASQALDQDIAALISNGPSDRLDLTTNTQPVMLAAAMAMYRAWLHAGGPAPELVAGHSLGEYSALTAAGALTLEDAVRVVRIRANAMQDAVPVGAGAMAVILGLASDAVKAVCSEAALGDVVEAVNFNAPEQVVIAGHKGAVDRACELAKQAGAKRALLLPVSAPFHSSLLSPAAAQLQRALASVNLAAPRIPLINNVDVASPEEPAAIKDALVRQACRPVRWVEVIQAMKARHVTHVVECGPGKVLGGLTKRIDRDLIGLSIADPVSLEMTLKALR